MKMTIEVDCTPEEARRFMGLPDVSALNDHLVNEMKGRIDANMSMISPDELMKNWMAFGTGAQEHFRKLMEVGMSAATRKGPTPSSRPRQRRAARRWRWCGFRDPRRRRRSARLPGVCRRRVGRACAI